jgi:hypothetical protein
VNRLKDKFKSVVEQLVVEDQRKLHISNNEELEDFYILMLNTLLSGLSKDQRKALISRLIEGRANHI